MDRLGPNFPPRFNSCSEQEEWVGYPMMICGWHQQPWPCEDERARRARAWPYHCPQLKYSASEEADKRRQRKTQWSAHNQRIPSAGVLYRRLAAVLGGG